jgi:zeaxanthin glucosyltransferase
MPCYEGQADHMQRPSILLLPFHGIGHFNALYGVAQALNKTHNVVFAGTSYFFKHVTSNGFPYITLNSLPFGLGLENWIHETRKSRFLRLRSAVDRWKDTVYYQRTAELTGLLDGLRPAHVLIDSQQATDLVVIKAINPDLKLSLVTLTPPYLLLPGLPPINGESLEKNLQNIRAKRWRQRWKYFGIDDRGVVDRRLRRNKLTHLKDDHPSLINFAAKDVDHYILTYKEFDFHHPYLDNFKYVGPHLVGDYIAPPEKKAKRLVYCALGTVPSSKNVDAFFAKVNKAAMDLDCEVIFGLPGKAVQQQTVLSRADVFVTHGGINSIHEAIRYKVPMIVYPVDPNYDQRGNASRVVHHGFGLSGDFDHATAEDIRSSLVRIFTDISFKKKLEAFDTSAYTVDTFVKMILS